MNMGALFYIEWKQLSNDIPEWANCKYGMVCWKCSLEAEYKHSILVEVDRTLEQILNQYNI